MDRERKTVRKDIIVLFILLFSVCTLVSFFVSLVSELWRKRECHSRLAGRHETFCCTSFYTDLMTGLDDVQRILYWELQKHNS